MPNKEPVKLVALMLPVCTVEPEILIEPVKVKVSALAVNKVIPVDPTRLVEPLIIKDPLRLDEPVTVNPLTTFNEFKFASEPDTIIMGARYNSVMNLVSNIPNITKYYLQQQNITNKTTRILKIEDSVDTDETPVVDHVEPNE